MTVHPHHLTPAAEVAVGLLFAHKELEPLAHRLGILSRGVGVARAQVGQQGQARQRGVGLPVRALAEASLADRTVLGEILLALRGRAVVVPGGAGVPSAVLVLVAGQPVESALHGQFAGFAGTVAAAPLRAVRIKPRLIDSRDIGEGPTDGPLVERRQSRAGSRRRSGLRRHAIQGQQAIQVRCRSCGGRGAAVRS